MCPGDERVAPAVAEGKHQSKTSTEEACRRAHEEREHGQRGKAGFCGNGPGHFGFLFRHRPFSRSLSRSDGLFVAARTVKGQVGNLPYSKGQVGNLPYTAG